MVVIGNQSFLSHFHYNMSSETQVCEMLLLFTIYLIFLSPMQGKKRKSNLAILLPFSDMKEEHTVVFNLSDL